MPDQIESPAPPATNSQRPPLKVFGGYEIEGELGRGGMGVVYLARQTELNRLVALKMLTGHYGEHELKRFLEEAETAAALSHSNIVHIYEVGEHEGAPFFSMEYVKAGSLADVLRKELPSPQDAARLLMEVARALHFAHQNGVVHRDMKPANILIGTDNEPKVTDFGIAKRLTEDTKLTRTGAVLGTPTYMAPEQAKGHSRHVGPSADVYSLGAILYEMLTGRPPFLPEESETAITVRVLTEQPVSPAWHRPEIPRELETICMKCLEKEPRNRYSSAAALAEDLRRFLDDEPILAKPPSTVMSSIRWVRRHPWKAVASAVLLLLIVAGITRLVQWQLYQRPHLEYATEVAWVNGVLEPVEKVSEDAASHRAAYLRLTRRGSRGPITKVEVLNARGHPAVLRRVLNDEMIPIYIEGLTGAQPYAERLPESTTVEFSFDENNHVQEAISRDRNGLVIWRIIYDRPSNTSSGQTVGARFVNMRGYDAATRNGASHMEFERDAKGRDVKITFFNASGTSAANGEGVYGYKLERDDAGRITQLVNLGANGQPAANRAGLIAYTTSWGKEIRSEFRDAKGQPTLWQGVAAIVTERDDAGNPVRITMLSADGKPARDAALIWSVQEMKRNEHGELTESTSLKANPDGSLTKVSQTRISYNQFGHPADIQSTGASTQHWALQHDANGNLTEEKALDAQGQPIVNDKGYAITRYAYMTSPQGLRIEQTYFDAAGNKTYTKDGYHRLISEFDNTNNLRRQIFDEYDQTRFKYYRFVSEPEYDSQNRLRHQITRYEDAQGHLATNTEYSFAASEISYDEDGHITAEWDTASDPQSFGGAILHVETSWYSNGKMKRRVQQYCDENRQPLPVIHTGKAAHSEEEFDNDGLRTRIYQAGFDEQLVGFSTLEAKFSGGKLQSVTHTRSDGAELKSVDVFIASVNPPPEQSKAAELKAGDQIIAFNGKPVMNAFSLFATGEFPGGSLEVLREGRRIRIDGFVPGSLGFTMRERAPAENQ